MDTGKIKLTEFEVKPVSKCYEYYYNLYYNVKITKYLLFKFLIVFIYSFLSP